MSTYTLGTEDLVFTGMGAVTPLGMGVETYWEQLVGGACGVGPITRFDAAHLPVRIAAEVKDFCADKYLPHSVLRASALFMQFALVAAKEAFAQSKLDVSSAQAQIGVVFATAMGGISAISETGQQYLLSRSKKVTPHFVPAVISNMGAAHAAIYFGLEGPSLTVHTACAAGGDAIMTAAMLLSGHACEAVLVLGGESILCDVAVSSLAQAKALSRANDDPLHASRPFDLNRDGFVIGEGGGALVLERASFAHARKAPILATLAGYANTMDGYHITAPHPEGLGAARCMERALQRAAIAPCEIGYINAHGTATVLGDIAEVKALKRVFGAQVPPISSTKGATGHLMGAGGLTEVIACIEALRSGLLPPTINCTDQDPACDVDVVALQARKQEIRYAMSNALGFGGQNSSIIIKRADTTS